MKGYAIALVLAVPLWFAPAAQAQQETFMVNPDTSQVNFLLGGNTHHVQGTFHVQSGTIEFDPMAGTISGMVIVSATSGNSGDNGRDKNMHEKVLQSGQYPEVTFAPKTYQGKLAPAGDSTVQVSGVFTLHGTPHDITVPMQVHIEGSNLTAKGQFTVPYVKWGLKDPSVFILKVAKDVDIDLDLSGRVTLAN